MYRQLKNPLFEIDHNNPIRNDVVLRISDNTYIPTDPENTDYQEYLKWIAANNQPLAANTA